VLIEKAKKEDYTGWGGTSIGKKVPRRYRRRGLDQARGEGKGSQISQQLKKECSRGSP